jgi:hypothetical protein
MAMLVLVAETFSTTILKGMIATITSVVTPEEIL